MMKSPRKWHHSKEDIPERWVGPQGAGLPWERDRRGRCSCQGGTPGAWGWGTQGAGDSARTYSVQRPFSIQTRSWTQSCLNSCIRMETTPTSTSVTAGSCWILREVRGGLEGRPGVGAVGHPQSHWFSTHTAVWNPSEEPWSSPSPGLTKCGDFKSH